MECSMMKNAEQVEVLSRRRVSALLWMVAGFLAVLASIAVNDWLAQQTQDFSGMRKGVLAVLAVGAVIMISNIARLVLIILRSRNDRALRGILWDELASTNFGHSMIAAFAAMLLVLIVLAIFSMFTTLSAPWVINALLATAFGVQAVAFARLELKDGDVRD
jgi:hypothetical protein